MTISEQVSTISGYGTEDASVVSEPPSSNRNTPITIIQTTDAIQAARKSASCLHAWYHITISIFSASTSAAMPFAFAYLGWEGGPTMLMAVAVASFYAGTLIIQLQEREQKTYVEVADSILGRGFSNRFIRPFQAVNFFLCEVLILLVMGKSMQALQEIISPASSPTLSLPLWILIGGITLFVLAVIPSIAAMWEVSLCGTFAGAAAAVLMLIGCINTNRNGIQDEIGYGRPQLLNDGDERSAASFAFGVLNSFGIALLGFSGHGVFPDIQTSLRGNNDDGCETTNNVRETMGKGLRAAYAVILPCQMLSGAAGYSTFGSSVSGFVIDDLRPHASDSLLIATYLLLAVNQLAVGSIYMQAAFTLTKELFPTLAQVHPRVNGGNFYSFKELLARLAFVAIAIFTSAAIPFFGHLAGLTGAVGYTPFSLIYPFVFWNKKWSSSSGTSWRVWLHVFLAVTFALIALGAVVGALYSIIQESSSYRFFS